MVGANHHLVQIFEELLPGGPRFLGVNLIDAKNFLRPEENTVRTFQAQLPVWVNF
jgi:hypothetical protein